MKGRIILLIVLLLAIVVVYGYYAYEPQQISANEPAGTLQVWGDPKFDYVYVKTTDECLCGIVGTDQWPLEESPGSHSIKTNTRAYFCDIDEVDAVPLQIPAIRGSNQKVIGISDPAFVCRDKWFCTTIYTDVGELYAIAWSVKTSRPYLLGKLDRHYRPRNIVSRAYAKACEQTITPKPARADTCSVSIPVKGGLEAWERDCTPGWPPPSQP